MKNAKKSSKTLTDLKELATELMQPAGNTPVAIDAANTTATAAPAPETPKDTQQPVAPKVVRGVRKESEVDIAARAARHDEATAEWKLITELAAQGLDRSAISKQTGISYSRLTFVLWHKKYGVDAIPGMKEYTKARKDAAQKVYEKDVAARKAG